MLGNHQTNLINNQKKNPTKYTKDTLSDPVQVYIYIINSYKNRLACYICPRRRRGLPYLNPENQPLKRRE